MNLKAISRRILSLAGLQQELEISRNSMRILILESGWMILDRFIRLALGVLVGAWVARHLGPEQFGELAYALAFIALFSAFANLGMNAVIVRDIARDDAPAPEMLGSAFALRLGAGIFAWSAAVTVTAATSGPQDVLLIGIAGASLIFQAADTIDLWFQSKHKNRLTVVAKLVAYLVANGLRVLLILTNAPLIAFAAVIGLEAALAAWGLVIAYRLFPTAGRWKLVLEQSRLLIGESWPYMLSGLTVMLYIRLDQIMLKQLLGSKAVGIYAAALPLSQLWEFIPVTLSLLLAPHVARKRTEDYRAYILLLLRIFRAFLVISLLASIVTAVFADTIVALLYDNQFSEAGPTLAILVFSNVFIALGVAQSLWLVNEGRRGLALTRTALGCLVSIVGNLVLIPLYGVPGVAVVAVVSQAIAAVISNIFFAPQIFLMQLGFTPREYRSES